MSRLGRGPAGKVCSRHASRLSRTLQLLVLFCLWFAAGLALASPGVPNPQEPDEADHFRAGLEATKLGEFDRAVEEYKKVLAVDPNLVEARVNLGLSYHALGQYTLAVEELSKAARERPNLLGPNIILGVDYMKLGFPGKAMPPLQRALSLESSNREARRALAACYLALGRYSEALGQFRLVFSLEPDKVEANFGLGHDYLGIATRLVSRLAKEYPNSAWGYRLAGDVLCERGLWNDAIHEYRRALAIQPSQQGLRTAAGRDELRQGLIEAAKAEFETELQLDSRSESAWLGIAETSLASGDATVALKAVAKAWEISPEFVALQPDFPAIKLDSDLAIKLVRALQKAPEGAPRHFLLSSLYRVLGETAAAYEQGAALQTDLASWRGASEGTMRGLRGQEACTRHLYAACAESLQGRKQLSNAQRFLLGTTLLTLRQFEGASRAFFEALATQRNNPEAIYWLIQIFQRLAAECLNKVEDLSPNSWRAHELRGEAFQLRQADEDAVHEFRIAVQLRPTEAELHEVLGDLYLSKNSYDEAEAELQKSYELDSSRARTLLLLGRLYVRRHESEKALPYLQKALRYQPDMFEASAVLGTAYLRMGQASNAAPELEKASPFDYYGNVNYQLYLAYRKLGKMESAQKALARSQELRRKSAAIHQARVAGAIDIE